jgi:hypothetical protein
MLLETGNVDSFIEKFQYFSHKKTIYTPLILIEKHKHSMDQISEK